MVYTGEESRVAFMLDPEVQRGLEAVKASLAETRTALQTLLSALDVEGESRLKTILDWMVLQPLQLHLTILEVLIDMSTHST